MLPMIKMRAFQRLEIGTRWALPICRQDADPSADRKSGFRNVEKVIESVFCSALRIARLTAVSGSRFPQGAQECRLAVCPGCRRGPNLTLCEIADRLELMA